MIFNEIKKTHIFYIIPLLVLLVITVLLLLVITGDLNLGAKPCGDANLGVATLAVIFRLLLFLLPLALYALQASLGACGVTYQVSCKMRGYEGSGVISGNKNTHIFQVYKNGAYCFVSNNKKNNQRWSLTTVQCFEVLGLYMVYQGRGNCLLEIQWWWSRAAGCLSCFSCSLAPSAPFLN